MIYKDLSVLQISDVKFLPIKNRFYFPKDGWMAL